jgi:hypothetical protein
MSDPSEKDAGEQIEDEAPDASGIEELSDEVLEDVAGGDAAATHREDGIY